MRKYFFIGLGGFLGAISRFGVKNIKIFNYNGGIPVNTLIINISGSFILGLVLTMTLKKFKMEEDIKLGISTGFLGAYTTFSTLCKETVNLLQGEYYVSAMLYVLISTVLGLTAAYLGIRASKKLMGVTR